MAPKQAIGGFEPVQPTGAPVFTHAISFSFLQYSFTSVKLNRKCAWANEGLGSFWGSAILAVRKIGLLAFVHMFGSVLLFNFCVSMTKSHFDFEKTVARVSDSGSRPYKCVRSNTLQTSILRCRHSAVSICASSFEPFPAPDYRCMSLWSPQCFVMALLFLTTDNLHVNQLECSQI